MSQTQSGEGGQKLSPTNVRIDLDRLEGQIADLKVLYEQYFSGIITRPPDAEHARLKQLIRNLKKAPFKNSALNYRLRSLETRYNTFNTYWQRVLREKDEGRYSRDLFKASLREKKIQEDAHKKTALGAAESGMKALFKAYRHALEKTTGDKQEIDFESFKTSLTEKTKSLQRAHEGKKVSLRVVIKDGKVVVQAKLKGDE